MRIGLSFYSVPIFCKSLPNALIYTQTSFQIFFYINKQWQNYFRDTENYLHDLVTVAVPYTDLYTVMTLGDLDVCLK